MGTFTDFLRQLIGLSTAVLDEKVAEDFLTNIDKVLEQYKLVLSENLTVAPTVEDISRYYVYYAAFTKYNAIKGNVEWDTADTYPMDFEIYNEKVATGGWSFLRNSIGIPINEWNILLPEPSYEAFGDESYEDESYEAEDSSW